MVSKPWLISYLVALALPAITRGAEHQHAAQRGACALDVYADRGRAYVLTAESREGSDKPVLLLARSDDGGATWPAPVRVDEGMAPGYSLHRGMDAQVAASGDHLVAVWMTAGTDKWGSGPMATALSSDGGKTWRPGPNPADDGSTTGHGFIDITADAAGVFHLTWLDSRDGKQGLRYARSADSGKTWSVNATVKAGTCECCSNALAAGPDGNIAILFRDGSPRDMTVAHSPDGGVKWNPPRRAGGFEWQFNGCPHVGGGLAFSGGKLHAVVWTGLQEYAGIYYVAATSSSEAWSEGKRLGDASTSHPDIAAGSHGELAVVWEKRTEGMTVIEGAISKDLGVTWSAPVHLSIPPGTPTHPRILPTPRGFRVFWTESAEGKPGAWRSVVMDNEPGAR